MLDLSAPEWLTIAGAIITLVGLEGLLSADNALVLAVMVRHLPKAQQKRALRYGIWGAFIFRAIAVIGASFVMKFWWLKVVGGLYLLYLAIKHFATNEPEHSGDDSQPRPGRGFWATVINVELADIAFSVDSILAAVGMADSLPEHVANLDLFEVPWVGMIQLKLLIIYIGGVLGIVAMRLVAGVFLLLLERFKGLAAAAYVLVAWIGLNLVGSGLHSWHREWPVEMPEWLFWTGMALIVIASLFYKPRESSPTESSDAASLVESAQEKRD